jgi:hypothetical protein
VAARPHARSGFTTSLYAPLCVLTELLKTSVNLTEFSASEFYLRLLASPINRECAVFAAEVIHEKIR